MENLLFIPLLPRSLVAEKTLVFRRMIGLSLIGLSFPVAFQTILFRNGGGLNVIEGNLGRPCPGYQIEDCNYCGDKNYKENIIFHDTSSLLFSFPGIYKGYPAALFYNSILTIGFLRNYFRDPLHKCNRICTIALFSYFNLI